MSEVNVTVSYMTNTYYEIKKSYIYLLKKSSSFNYPIAQLNPIATNKYLTILYQSNDDILNLASRVLNSTRLSSRTFSSTLQQIIKNYDLQTKICRSAVYLRMFLVFF